jgi:hypothetical protein
MLTCHNTIISRRSSKFCNAGRRGGMWRSLIDGRSTRGWRHSQPVMKRLRWTTMEDCDGSWSTNCRSGDVGFPTGDDALRKDDDEWMWRALVDGRWIRGAWHPGLWWCVDEGRRWRDKVNSHILSSREVFSPTYHHLSGLNSTITYPECMATYILK